MSRQGYHHAISNAVAAADAAEGQLLEVRHVMLKVAQVNATLAVAHAVMAMVDAHEQRRASDSTGGWWRD